MWTTGKVKDKSVHATHHTEADAVAWIDRQSAIDPEGVARGDYFIDPPADPPADPPPAIGDYHPFPWKVAYAVRFDTWHPQSSPCVVDANGELVFEPPLYAAHLGLYDAQAVSVCEFVVAQTHKQAVT